jgi:hypothetical protein
MLSASARRANRSDSSEFIMSVHHLTNQIFPQSKRAIKFLFYDVVTAHCDPHIDFKA